jgi:HK97 family phage major capsid protein
MPDLKELRGKLDERRDTLATIFAEAKTDDANTLDLSKATGLKGKDDTARVAEIKALNDEIDAIAAEAKPLEEAEAEVTRAKRNAEKAGEFKGRGNAPEQKGREREEKQVKSFGEMFTDANVGTTHKGREVELSDFELKTAFTTAAGWAPEALRTGRVVLDAQRPIQVIDLIPASTTDQSAIVYMEETTFTNNAVETAEGIGFGEAALALTERTSPVRKIPVFIPVTDEQLEDVAQVQSYLTNRLTFMLRQRLDGQILVGDGNAPNLEGFLTVSNVQTQAKGSDPSPDAIYKGMTKVRVTGRAFPNAVVYHPNDWQDIRLLRTADGIYIWGNPSEAGPEKIWGLPVVQSDAITEGTALVGDFANFSDLATKRGITVKVSDSHDTYFTTGKQAVRADTRVALTVYRPEAFCEVTGL